MLGAGVRWSDTQSGGRCRVTLWLLISSELLIGGSNESCVVPYGRIDRSEKFSFISYLGFSFSFSLAGSMLKNTSKTSFGFQDEHDRRRWLFHSFFFPILINIRSDFVILAGFCRFPLLARFHRLDAVEGWRTLNRERVSISIDVMDMTIRLTIIKMRAETERRFPFLASFPWRVMAPSGARPAPERSISVNRGNNGRISQSLGAVSVVQEEIHHFSHGCSGPFVWKMLSTSDVLLSLLPISSLSKMKSINMPAQCHTRGRGSSWSMDTICNQPSIGCLVIWLFGYFAVSHRCNIGGCCSVLTSSCPLCNYPTGDVSFIFATQEMNAPSSANSFPLPDKFISGRFQSFHYFIWFHFFLVHVFTLVSIFSLFVLVDHQSKVIFSLLCLRLSLFPIPPSPLPHKNPHESTSRYLLFLFVLQLRPFVCFPRGSE